MDYFAEGPTFTVIDEPSSGCPTIEIRVLVSVVWTLPVEFSLYQYVPLWSSKTGTPSCAGILVSTPSLCSEKPGSGTS